MDYRTAQRAKESGVPGLLQKWKDGLIYEQETPLTLFAQDYRPLKKKIAGFMACPTTHDPFFEGPRADRPNYHILLFLTF